MPSSKLGELRETEFGEEISSSSKNQTITTGIIDLVWDFCRTSALGDIFDGFVRKHIDELRDLQPLDKEQKLRHTEIFEELLKVCEDEVTDFLREKNSSTKEFVRKFREVLEDNDADPDLKWFVTKFLGCLEYTKFHALVSEQLDAATSHSK